MNDWYNKNIESKIRPLVKFLRDNGINTTGSCAHEKYVIYATTDTSPMHIQKANTVIKEFGHTKFVNKRISSTLCRIDIKGNLFDSPNEIKNRPAGALSEEDLEALPPKERERRFFQAERKLHELEKERHQSIRAKLGVSLWEHGVPRLTLEQLTHEYAKEVYAVCGEVEGTTSDWLGISRVTFWRMKKAWEASLEISDPFKKKVKPISFADLPKKYQQPPPTTEKTKFLAKGIMHGEKVITAGKAAEMLGLCRRTLLRRTDAGVIKCVPVGRKRQYLESEIIEYKTKLAAEERQNRLERIKLQETIKDG